VANPWLYIAAAALLITRHSRVARGMAPVTTTRSFGRRADRSNIDRGVLGQGCVIERMGARENVASGSGSSESSLFQYRTGEMNLSARALWAREREREMEI